MRKGSVFFKKQGLGLDTFLELILLLTMVLILYPSIISAMIPEEKAKVSTYEEVCRPVAATDNQGHLPVCEVSMLHHIVFETDQGVAQFNGSYPLNPSPTLKNATLSQAGQP